MSKSKRLIELMMTVNRKKRFTVQELADEFQVSYRTILRDLQELSELGVPLYSEVGVHGGYGLVNERVLPPIAFTEGEAVSMFFASQSLKFYDELPFEAEAKSALRKFYHCLPPDTQKRIERMRDRVVLWNPKREHPGVRLTTLLEAAIRQCAVQISYDSAQGVTERRIQPIGLYTYNGYWYCPDYCFEREDYRLFRVDRVLATEIPEEQEECIDISQVSLMDFLQVEDGEKKDMPLRVTFTREGVRRVRSDQWLGRLLQVHEDGNGTIDSWMPERKVDYCASLLFALGSDAMVLEPSQVIDRIRLKALALLQIYEPSE